MCKAERLVVTLMLLLALTVGHAQLRWTPVNPLPTENAFFSVAYGGGTFVAVGDFGVIATSADGAHWVFRESGTPAALESVLYANSHFVAAASDGTVLISPDGIDWVSRSSGAAFSVNNLAYGNGTYVIAGNSETFMTSADGQAWTPHTLPYTCYFNQTVNDGPDHGTIVFANGRFVAAYEDCVLSSADGINWTLYSFGGSSSWTLDYINGKFIAVDGPSLAESSSDGVNWTPQASANTYPLAAVCKNSTSCIGLGDQTLTQNIAQSNNGSAWKTESIAYSINGNAQFPSASSSPLKALAYGNGIYVVVGASGIVSYSADGINWMSGAFDLPDVLRSVAYGNSLYVAVGDRGTVQTSSDGQHWNQLAPQATGNLYAVTYGNGTFVAAGTHGGILTSPDGTTWTPRTSVTTADLMAIVHGSAGFVTVGSQGTVLTSTDAVTWNVRTSGVTSTLRAVAFGATHYVAVGDVGDIVESSTGVSWTHAAHGDITTSLYSLAYGNGQFVALGQPYPIFSTDGITWKNAAVELVGPVPMIALTFGGGLFMTPNQSFTSLSSTGTGGCCAGGLQSTSLTIRAVVYGAPGYVGVGNSGAHMFSTDGSTWITAEPGSPNADSRLSGIAANGSTIMAVGIDFASMQSGLPADLALISNDNGVSWKPLPTGYWNNAMTGVAYYDGSFVASGSSSGDAVVYDGLGWTTHSIGIGTYLTGISYTNDRYFVMGNSGQFATSFDGATWQPQSLNTYSVNGVAYGLGTYVLVGSDIYVSPDATNWNHVYSAGGYEFNTAAFGRNIFVAAGSGGVAISKDSSNWTQVCPSANSISSLIFDGTKFVAVGSDAYVSFDGVEWRRGLMHTVGPVHGVTHVSDGYIAVSEYGGIKQSADDLIFSNRFDGVACPL